MKRSVYPPRAAVGALFLMLCACAAPAEAQKIYRWTDERGVTHFGHQPPADRAAQEHRLPPAALQTAPAPAEAAPAAAEGAPENAAPADSEPAANVVLDDSQSALVGGTVQRFSGTVKNSGRAAAREVSVDIRVTEGEGGSECLRKQVAVSPANLPPGASGNYAVELQSPCFSGATSTDVRANWQ